MSNSFSVRAAIDAPSFINPRCVWRRPLMLIYCIRFDRFTLEISATTKVPTSQRSSMCCARFQPNYNRRLWSRSKWRTKDSVYVGSTIAPGARLNRGVKVPTNKTNRFPNQAGSSAPPVRSLEHYSLQPWWIRLHLLQTWIKFYSHFWSAIYLSNFTL